MTNHPNRSARARRGRNPKPAEIARLREEMQMTQTAAAALVHGSLRGWQDWEYGKRRMHASIWEYLCLMQAYPQVERARRLWLQGAPDVGQH